MRRYTVRWSRRLVYLTTVLALVLNLTPIPTFPPPAVRADTLPVTPAPPAPDVLRVTPPANPHLPGLLVSVAVAPDPLAVGTTATVTVTVSNEGDDPAQALVVTAPAPDGATPLPGEGFLSAKDGWRWTIPTLAANASTTVRGALLVTAPPPGDALLIRAEATARGLANASTGAGGALFAPALAAVPGPGTVLPSAAPDPQATASRAAGAPVRPTVGAATPTPTSLTTPGASATPQPTTATYLPGQDTTLRSADGRVRVTLPKNAASEALTLSHGTAPAHGERVPTGLAGRSNGLGTFYLGASDARGQAVHRFAAPLAVAVAYTPEQLRARHLTANDLTLFWFDEDQGRWLPLPTTVDEGSGVATATVDHFSAFQLSDGAQPSLNYLPNVKGWQTDLFTGAATYGMPLDVPAGPGGVKPPLNLRYNSQAVDGTPGEHAGGRAGWAGLGWSLDPGAVALQRTYNDGETYYNLSFDGHAYLLIRGAALVTGASPDNPSQWEWKTTDETYLRVRVDPNGSTDGQPDARGVSRTMSTAATPPNPKRYKWRVRTTANVLYEFDEDLWQGQDNCAPPGNGTVNFETYKWLLTRMVDAHGNTITYTYDRKEATATASCNAGQGTVQADAWPSRVTWGGNVTTGAPDRYKVRFDSWNRCDNNQYCGDQDYDHPSNQFGGDLGQPRPTRVLMAVQVYSNSSNPYQDVEASWELARRYQLGYTFETHCDQTIQPNNQQNNDCERLTLKSMQLLGKDGTTALPATTFAYGTDRGTGDWPNGNWNRLTGVNNGQGGTVAFAYEQIGPTVNNGHTNQTIFHNRRRVTAKTVGDGRGQAAVWGYQYTEPELNGIGWLIDGLDGAGHTNQTQAYPNSAILYLNRAAGPNVDANKPYLVIPSGQEFRGHSSVTETDPSGTRRVHWFYQGSARPGPDPQCQPSQTGSSYGAYETDQCFVDLRYREFLKGREWQAETQRPGDNAAMTRTETRYDVLFKGYGQEPVNGVWQAWSYAASVREGTFEGTGTGVYKTTNYDYSATTSPNPYQQDGGQYGNLVRTAEYDGDQWTNAATPRLRLTERWYNSFVDQANLQVATVQKEAIRGVTDGVLLALTNYFYDGILTGYGVGAKGELQLVRKHANPATKDRGSDTAYGYDAYHNQTSMTTYAGYATSEFGAAGGGGAARTTTATYDPLFHAFATVSTPPDPNGVGLTETAAYDTRMGTLTGVTDANGATTSAEYDVFGRVLKVIKPGDTSAVPTSQLLYYDNEFAASGAPTRYQVAQLEQAGNNGAVRPTSYFYDGLGRQIQTKRESVDGTQNIVTDTQYDGLDRTVKTSQARYVAETSGTFYAYTPVPTSGVNWTTTSYDPLGRTYDLTMPDNTVTRTRYFSAAVGMAASVTDANGHKTRRETDMFGRLRAVLEYSGTADTGADPYALYATTTYAYDGRDLLTGVTDQAGNVTAIGYDGNGRKVGMTDPDMGAWAYTYNPTGTLATQADAKGQTITFAYDALDRLTTKSYATGYPTAYFRYDEADVANGRGRRTTMMNTNTGTRYAYDARGRQASTTSTVAGLAESRTFEWTYDSADRVQAMKYPALPGNAAQEQVTYTYDAAWRQTGLGGLATYAQNATYTALDQPLTTPLGNGTTQSWAYDPLMQRLQSSTVGNGALNRSYTYDPVGNVQTITDNLVAQTQTFAYDARDRLTHAATSGGTVGTYDETDTYDPLGNLTSKGATGSPVAYAYPTGGQGVARPHAPTTIGGRAETYDANGNLTGDPGRLALTWSAENQPLSVTSTNAQAAPQSWGDQNCDGASQPRTSPDTLGGFGGVTAFARGNDQVLAVTGGGTVLACGQNSQGQLGDGTTTNRTAPVAVGGLSGVAAVAAGEQYSLALKADGTVWSWGYNGDGRLGDGTNTTRYAPVQVGGLTGVVAIAAGRDFGLAVKADGTVWAWGGNSGSQLGDGTTTARYTPVAVSGLAGITAVAAGYSHGLARKTDGTVWGWGSNSGGQLGDGSTTTRATPVQVSGLTGVTAIAAGDTHSLAVKSDGTVQAWGANGNGQLGDGTTTARYTPVAVGGLTTATAVAGGANHSLALLADGTVRAWGANNYGQLGDGTTTQRVAPVAVGGLQGVDKLAARANGSLARPTQASEQYTYDADGLRVTRSTGGATWLYLGGGSWEERLGGNTSGPGGWVVRTLYTLQRRTIAQQESTPGAIYGPQGRIFLLGDHLGSVSVVTDTNGQVVSRQDSTPWGEARGSDITQTTLDFTGQRKDGTGLLYYGARYYDPVLGRFLSPDSIVPGMASGKGGMAATLGQDSGAALRPLAVDFHESGFAAGLAREDAFTQAKGFWFQLSNREKQRGEGSLWQWGPRNPQALDRYSYALNNPLRYTDPTGHDCFDAEEGGSGLCGGGGGGGEGGGEGGGGGGYSGGGGGGGGGDGAGEGESAGGRYQGEISVSSKAGIRSVLEQLELPELQRAKVNRIIQKSGSATSYDLVLGADNTVIIRYYRPGGNGYQVFEYVVDENGSRISVTQYAFDRDGNLVHVDVKKGDSGGDDDAP